MRLRGLLPRLRRRLTPRRPRPAILMYHRVASLKHDPWELAVSPAHFEEQIAYLKRHRTPLPMQELVRRWKAGTLPANAVGITFDDGYRDNLVEAQPVLAKYGVPATVFLATGFIDGSAPYWWDELASMILESTVETDDAQVCAGHTVLLRWGSMEPADLDPHWRGWDKPQTSRQRAYVDLWSRMQTTSHAERQRVLSDLRPRFPVQSDPLSLPMSADEVRAMVAGGLMSVEAHTIVHASLTDLTRQESQAEIAGSAAQCRVWTTQTVEGFAFPYGNFSEAASRDVESAGLSWACTTHAAFLDEPNPGAFALPRLTPPNAGIENFARLLTG